MGLFNSMNFPMVVFSSLKLLQTEDSRLRTFADGSQFFTEPKWSNWLVNVVVRGTILFIFYQKECYEFEENSRFIFLLSPFKF